MGGIGRGACSRRFRRARRHRAREFHCPISRATSSGRCATGPTRMISSSSTARKLSIGRCMAATPRSVSMVATGRSSSCTCRVAAATCGLGTAERPPGRNGSSMPQESPRGIGPGELLYEIERSTVGCARPPADCTCWRMHETDGLGAQVRSRPAGRGADVELIVAFGGVNGQRGVRDGDIGTERVPISQWFAAYARILPRQCDLSSTVTAFELRSAVAKIAGVLPQECNVVSSAMHATGVMSISSWSPTDTTPALPVLVARVPLAAGSTAIPRVAAHRAWRIRRRRARHLPRRERRARARAAARQSCARATEIDQLPQVFARTRDHFGALRERVSVRYAGSVPQRRGRRAERRGGRGVGRAAAGVMHGAIAWRARLLGWRGPYAMDALGWHDRARRHLEYWATRQNTRPVPDDVAARRRGDAPGAEPGGAAQQRRHVELPLRHEPGLHRCAVPASAVDRRPRIRAPDLAGDRTPSRLGAASVPPRVRSRRNCHCTRPTRRSGPATICNTTAAASRTHRPTTSGTTRWPHALAEVVRQGCRAVRARGRR